MDGAEVANYPVADLVPIARFGEPIYPYLQPMDKVENAPDSDLWHALVQADNYHALQLLAYLYPGMVDCIYIDPPYNTGARDWKYNNDYVDTSDQYRHSKWLSMMEKRLKLAKRLLNPKDSVLIVTIDEKEYLHLGCLLEEMFPEARIQMVSSVINPKGQSRNGQFGRTDEYIFFTYFGTASVQKVELSQEWLAGKSTSTNDIRWQSLRRAGKTGQTFRHSSPGCFYPIFVNQDLTLHSVGEALSLTETKNSVNIPEGAVAVWPMRADGQEGCYQVSPQNLRSLYNKGYFRINSLETSGMLYLKRGEQEKVEDGTYNVIGRRQNDNSVITEVSTSRKSIPGTQWKINTHNAGDYGTNIIDKLIGATRFSFPKSLYAVHDTIRFFVANKPNALIVDFFAGSGTTLHAVNLLNAEDGGKRRCIMVTNNEVSDAEAKELTKKGYKPGDDEWERLGIAQYVNWPRTVCSIKGVDVNGNPLKGDYLGGDKDNPLKMADGFKANAAFFRLGFLDKDDVALGRQFNELLPLLWLKSGAKGACPQPIDNDDVPPFFVYGNFAVLTDECYFYNFRQHLAECEGIDYAYIVTDSDAGFREMSTEIDTEHCIQLYRDYLDNFRINRAR